MVDTHTQIAVEVVNKMGPHIREAARASAKEAISELKPYIFATSKQVAEEVAESAKKLLVLELTGDEYADRKEIRNGIQWAMASYKRGRLLFRLTFGAIATGAAAAAFKLLAGV